MVCPLVLGAILADKLNNPEDYDKYLNEAIDAFNPPATLSKWELGWLKTAARLAGDASKLKFESQEPKVLTYHSAKGLTFDAVFMPRLVQSSFKRLTSELIERLLFVGISRAVKWVFMSTTEDKELPHLASLYALADQKKLTIKKYSDAPDKTTSEQKEPDTEQDKSDDLIDIL